MTDTSDDSATTERPAAESGEQPAKKPATKTAKKTVKKTARKPARSGAPRASARKPADDRPHDNQEPRREHDQHQQGRHGDGGTGNGNGGGRDGDSGGQGDSQRRPRPKGMRLAVQAAEQLVGLTGKEFEGIVGLSKSEDGWAVAVEVLEMRRVPSTTDVIAVYEVDVDQDGDLTGYRRRNRYLRGEAGDDR